MTAPIPTATVLTPPATDTAELEGLLVEELLSRIDTGEVSCEELPADLRRQCVSHLTESGCSSSEIARRLKVTERTIRRDRAAARREGAISPEPNMGDELLGEFQRLTYQSIQRLTRLSHDPQTPAYARLQAEEAIARTYRRLIETARELGYFEDGWKRINRAKNEADEIRRNPIVQAMLAVRQAELDKQAQAAQAGA